MLRIVCVAVHFVLRGSFAICVPLSDRILDTLEHSWHGAWPSNADSISTVLKIFNHSLSVSNAIVCDQEEICTGCYLTDNLL